MKLRLFIFAALAFALAACNMTLAADVTPPPNYVPPTPMPTLGPLYPPQPMDVENGAQIFIEKCSPCHGLTGLGDGEQGKQLPVKVAPLGLADFAQPALPSAWYTQVTRGNIERFMPPFASLTDQQRWDVVGYAMSLHTTAEQLVQGKELFEANCADCEKYFTDLETMSAWSEKDLMAIAKNGKDAIPAFGKNLSDAELAAVAAYLRSLTFAVAQPEPTQTPTAEPTATLEAAPTPAAETTPAADVTPLAETTPAAEVTPADGTPLATAESVAATDVPALGGRVSGSVDNQSGAKLPADTKVILRGYEHGGDMSAGPQEVVNLETTVNADGTYLFEDVALSVNRIFVAEIQVGGLTYTSEMQVVEEGMTDVVELPALVVYATTEDFNVLKISTVQIFFDFTNQQNPQMLVVYSILNDSDNVLRVKMSAEQTDVPFLAKASGVEQMGIEATQDSAPFLPTDDGFSMRPGEAPYGLVVFSSLKSSEEMEISQPVYLPVEEVFVLVPEGMEVTGEAFSDEGIQDMQGMKLHLYKTANIAKDGSIDFTLSGKPQSAETPATEEAQNRNLLFGVGALGLVLIGFGAWLFIRDRKAEDAEEGDEEDGEEDDEQNDTEDVMDAIIALDDLHRAGKLSDDAYRKRREELKGKLRK